MQEGGAADTTAVDGEAAAVASAEGPRLASPPQTTLDTWKRLCPHLRPKHLRILGLIESTSDEAVAPARAADDAGARWTALPTLRAFDESDTVVELLTRLAPLYDNSQVEAIHHILAEVEVSFILFAVTNDWTAFCVWRRWLTLLTAVDAAFLDLLPLFRHLLPLLQEQLTILPVDVFDTFGGVGGGEEEEEESEGGGDGAAFIRIALAGLLEIVASVNDDFSSRWPDEQLLAEAQRVLRRQVVDVGEAGRRLRRALERHFSRSFGSDADLLLARAAQDFAKPGDDLPSSSSEDSDNDCTLEFA
jgi:hypothetical protein